MAQQESNPRGAGQSATAPQRENAQTSPTTSPGQGRRQEEIQGKGQNQGQTQGQHQDQNQGPKQGQGVQGQNAGQRSPGQGPATKNPTPQDRAAPGRMDTDKNSGESEDMDETDTGPKSENSKTQGRSGENTGRSGAGKA